MSFFALIVALFGVGGLTLQCISCLAKRQFSIGVLDLFLAITVLLTALALFTGQMVLATEFGVVMIQGHTFRWLFQLELITVSILPGLCWYRIRKLNDWRASLSRVLAAGLTFGAAATTRVSALNPGSLESLRIYQYNVWWPFLILWFTFCFAGSILALLKAELRHLLVISTAALLSPLAAFALNFEVLANSADRLIWIVLERVGFVTAILLLLEILFQEQAEHKTPWKKRFLWNTVFALMVIGLAILALADLPLWLRSVLDFLPLALLTVIVATIVLLRRLDWSVLESVRKDSSNAPAQIPGSSAKRQPRSLPIKRLTGIVHSIALPVIALLLIDILSFGALNRTLEILILLYLWLLFGERIAEGALDNLPVLFTQGFLKTAPIQRLRGFLQKSSLWIARLGKAVKDFFTKGSKWMIAAKAVLIPLLLLGLLTAINELFNYRGIVVQPFEWDGGKDADDNISKSLTHGLINALGRMRKDLRADLILAQRNSSGEHPTDAHLLRTGIDSNTVEVAIAKSNELELSGIKVPLEPLVIPIQHVVRLILGIRVINGSIKKNADGYAVWVNSSDGVSWQESAVAIKQEIRKQKEEKDRGCPVEEKQDDGEIVDDLIEKLAFDIASSDLSFIAAGMTQSWPAFQDFRRGLSYWKNHEIRQDGDDLKNAIACFKEAIRQDRKFSIAFYRLGLAMQHDGQPEMAVAAFRDSVDVNPEFTAGVLAEASTLYSFNSYYPPVASVLKPIPPTPVEKQRQAFNIWTGLLDLPRSQLALAERQESYYGACLYQLDRAEEAGEGNYYLPYFYCHRAADLFYRLPTADRDNQDQRTRQAAILNLLGVALDSHLGKSRALGLNKLPHSWACAVGSIDPDDINVDGYITRLSLWGSRTSRYALKYYRRSLALAPEDSVVRCNVANAAAFLENDFQPMENLWHDPSVHEALAHDLSYLGYKAAHPLEETGSQSAREMDKAAGFYQRAITEYQAALNIDPNSIDALIGYGSTFWQWKMDSLMHKTSSAPNTDWGFQAEQYARQAERLAQARDLQDTELAAEETLGEVLMGQGRLEEARRRLDETIDHVKKLTIHWTGLNETLWDSAQARLCTCALEKSAKKKTFFEDALRAFEFIRSTEQAREWQPFSADPDAMDPNLRQDICPNAPNQPFPQSVFVMSKVSYEPGLTCEWSGVIGQLVGTSQGEVYFLHVWGGGVDRRVMLNNGRSLPVQLPVEQSHAYYFAQIENERRVTFSAIQSFDTYGKPKQGECTRNQVKIVFTDRIINPQKLASRSRAPIE